MVTGERQLPQIHREVTAAGRSVAATAQRLKRQKSHCLYNFYKEELKTGTGSVLWRAFRCGNDLFPDENGPLLSRTYEGEAPREDRRRKTNVEKGRVVLRASWTRANSRQRALIGEPEEED